MLNTWVAVPGELGGYREEASLSATLSGKEGGSGPSWAAEGALNGGGNSLLSGDGARIEAGDSFDRLIDASDIFQRCVEQRGSLQKCQASSKCWWVMWCVPVVVSLCGLDQSTHQGVKTLKVCVENGGPRRSDARSM